MRLYIDIDGDHVALVHLWCEWSARTDPDAPEEPFSPREVLHSAVAAAVHQAVESMQEELAAAGVRSAACLGDAVRRRLGMPAGGGSK